MKHGVQWVYSKSVYAESYPLPVKVFPKSFINAREVLEGGLFYSDMVSLFSSLKAQQSVWQLSADGKHEVVFDSVYDLRYSALEMMGHGKQEDFDVTTILFQRMRGHEKDVALEAIFDRSLKIRKGKVFYDYDADGVNILIDLIPQREIIIPDNFEFKWGSGSETQALINSIYLRCVYHVLCIDYAVEKFKMPGFFDSSLVLVLDNETLIHDLSFAADIGENKISDFIDFLTFGSSTKSPDIALQPFLKSVSGRYMLPCMFVITNDMQRNAMALEARVNKKGFDKQSKVFECCMLDRLMLAAERWPHKYKNKNFTVHNKKEEIDFLLIDVENKIIIAMECAWMLQPGDPNEIFNRVKTCNGKVDQIERKCIFLQNNIAAVLHVLKLSKISCDEWQVKGLVVIEGFGGQISRVDAFPVISINALKIALEESQSVSEIHSWAESLEWLPKENYHFERVQTAHDTQPVSVHEIGLQLTEEHLKYSEHVTASVRVHNKLMP